MFDSLPTNESGEVCHDDSISVTIYVCVCVVSSSVVSDFATPWTVVCQAPLSMGFSKKEYWSRLPFSRGSSRSRD